MAREKDDMKTLVVSQGRRIDALETTVGSLSDRITALAIGGTAEGRSKSDPPSTAPSPQATVAALSKGEIQQLIDITVDAAKKELLGTIEKLENRVSQLEKELADKRRLANPPPSQMTEVEPKPAPKEMVETLPPPKPNAEKPQPTGGNYERGKVSYEPPIIAYEAEYPSKNFIVEISRSSKPLWEHFYPETGVYITAICPFVYEVYFPLGWSEQRKEDWLKRYKFTTQKPKPPMENGKPKFAYGTVVNVRRKDHETLSKNAAEGGVQTKTVSGVFMPSGVRYTFRSYLDIDLIFPVGRTTQQIDKWLMDVDCVENAPKGTEPPPKQVDKPKPKESPQMPHKATEQPKEEYEPPQPKKVEVKPPKVTCNEWIPVLILFGSIILILTAITLWSQVKMIVICLGIFAFASGCVYALFCLFRGMLYGDWLTKIIQWMYDHDQLLVYISAMGLLVAYLIHSGRNIFSK